LVVLIASLTLALFALITICFSTSWNAIVNAVPADLLLGPLDGKRAAWVVFGALMHTMAATLLLLCLVHPRRTGRCSLILLILTAADIAIAQRGLVPSAPARQWGKQSPLVVLMESHRHPREHGQDIAPPMRFWRMAVPLPADWKEAPSLGRQAAGQRWDRQTLLPRYHLSAGVNSLGAHGAVRSQQLRQFWREREGRVNGGRKVPSEMTLQQLGVEFVIAPTGNSIARASPGENARVTCDSASVQLLRVDDAARVWVARSHDDLEPIPGDAAVCRFLRYEPALVELHVTLFKPGLVVLSDQAYSGWQCFVGSIGQRDKRQVVIQPVWGVLRGVALPAGEHRVAFRYRPATFMVGAISSAIAWAAAIGLALVAIAKRVLRRKP
jgi:hypothetical protein